MFCIIGKIDLWTRNSSGCRCNQIKQMNNLEDEDDNYTNLFHSNNTNDDSTNKCACCGKGGCQCGPNLITRCGQCGLENYCTNSKLTLKFL